MRLGRLAVLTGVILVATLVNASFVAEARHNARQLPVLIAAGAAGLVLDRRSRASTWPSGPGHVSGEDMGCQDGDGVELAAV